MPLVRARFTPYHTRGKGPRRNTSSQSRRSRRAVSRGLVIMVLMHISTMKATSLCCITGLHIDVFVVLQLRAPLRSTDWQILARAGDPICKISTLKSNKCSRAFLLSPIDHPRIARHTCDWWIRVPCPTISHKGLWMAFLAVVMDIWLKRCGKPPLFTNVSRS